MRKICVPGAHSYDLILKSKEVSYTKQGKAYEFNIAQAIMCTSCGDILFPEYPDKFTVKELERIADIASTEINKRIDKAVKRKKK